MYKFFFAKKFFSFPLFIAHFHVQEAIFRGATGLVQRGATPGRSKGGRVPQRMYPFFRGQAPLLTPFTPLPTRTVISEEGLFRVGAQGSRVEELKAGWDNGTMTTFTEKNPHNVATLLKHYFKELPEPLFISETYGRFNELVDEEDMNVKLQKLHTLVMCQPPNHLKTARFLFDFLKRLADNSSINKMTPSNMYPL